MFKNINQNRNDENTSTTRIFQDIVGNNRLKLQNSLPKQNDIKQSAINRRCSVIQLRFYQILLFLIKQADMPHLFCFKLLF